MKFLPLGAALALCLSAACASTTATIPHAKRLASAGVAYGKAADALIGATEETSVDADSARLLSEAQGLSREDRVYVLGGCAFRVWHCSTLLRLRMTEAG